jgi:hypothetical protein
LSFVVECVVVHTLRPIVAPCFISGGCRLIGGTCRPHLHDHGNDVDQNANIQPCYIKPLLHTKPLAEGKELGMTEKLFWRD